MIGLLGRKKGMTTTYDAKGRVTPVTVLAMGPCRVLEVKTAETHHYDAVKLAYDPVKPTNVTKPVAGQFAHWNVEPHRVVREIRGFSGDYQPGATLTVELFQPGDKVKVIGTSKGRGFAGVIKRHNFGRPNQSHGTHEIFRGGGSIGQHSYPARTWPGQKMPGRMGGARVTTKNLEVISVDAAQGLLLLRGAVPGANGGLVTVQKIR
jgi:large subunit ribosomal protein L3